MVFNPLNAELNPICHLLTLLGGATILVVSRLRVKTLTNFQVPRNARNFFKELSFLKSIRAVGICGEQESNIIRNLLRCLRKVIELYYAQISPMFRQSVPRMN